MHQGNYLHVIIAVAMPCMHGYFQGHLTEFSPH